MKLSIVTTMYYSSPYLREFHARASAAARQVANEDYEIVFVNDGSPDNSLDVAVQLADIDCHVVVVDLSRNFGHHKAMMAGLEYCRGDRVFLIDSDLEESPEWLEQFSCALDEEQADVIYGVQASRKGGWFERMSGAIFYWLFNKLSSIDHPVNIVTARVMTRRYVEALLQHREREIVISCLWVICGFKQCQRVVNKVDKKSSQYSLPKRIEHAVNAITSFSAFPLKLILYLGALILLGSLVYVSYLIVLKLFLGTPIDGWTSVMVSIWLLGGLTISLVGIVGHYLGKIFNETKQRPYVIIRGVYGRSKS
jgi:putative glycosyltransferase